jgi:hypothetical protein
MKMQGIAPKSLIAKRLESKDVSALRHQIVRTSGNRLAWS